MKAWRVLAAAVLAISLPLPAEASPVRTVLAYHDFYGRLANTKISKLGDLRAGRALFKIYNLSFSNPTSHHGMQHVAIFAANNRFVGAYIIDTEAVAIRGNTIIFEGAAKWGNVVIVTEKGPPSRAHIQGEVRILEDTI